RVGQEMTVTASGFEPGEPGLFAFIGAGHAIRATLQLADDQGNLTSLVELSPVPPRGDMRRVTGSQSGVSREQPVRVGEEIPDAIVRSEELNLRTGPGYDYPAIDVLVKGDELTVVAVNWDDTWLEVQTKTGRQGWVVADLVELNIS